MKFDYPSGLILPFDTACPSGWTRFSELDDRFPFGASTYGGTGGATHHSHSIDPGSVNTENASGTNYRDETDLAGHTSSSQSHYHAANVPATSTNMQSHYPPYIQVVYCKKD